MRALRELGCVITACAALGCGEGAITECRDEADAHVICGLQNPEDLVRVPGAAAIVVSEFGSMDEDKPGALALVSLASEKITQLFPQGGPGVAPSIDEGPDWGDAHCSGPPDQRFNPHGIDLRRRNDGALELYVVNHGGREAIELFELDAEAHVAHWRGCVPLPDQTFANDVAALPDGGFAVTHMFPKSYGAAALYHLARGTFGGDTGYVLTWRPGGRVTKLAHSDAPFPNGISATADGKEIFVNAYLASEVRRLALPSGKLLGRAHVQQPDNSAWAEDGTLLVASHVAGLSAMSACGRIDEGACRAAFEIVALDPKSMHTRVVLKRQGPPMGAATVALAIGRELYLGSFKSGWLLRVKR